MARLKASSPGAWDAPEARCVNLLGSKIDAIATPPATDNQVTRRNIGVIVEFRLRPGTVSRSTDDLPGHVLLARELLHLRLAEIDAEAGSRLCAALRAVGGLNNPVAALRIIGGAS